MPLSSWAENVAAEGRNALCSALATSESLASFLDSILPNGQWDNQIAAGARRGFCSNPTDAPSPQDFRPFPNGQCPGTTYSITWGGTATATRCDGSGPVTVTQAVTFRGTVEGPLGLRRNPGPLSTCMDGSSTSLQVSVFNTNNPSQASSITFNAASVGRDRIEPGSESLTFQSVTPAPGQPDDCGGPPPEIPPFSPITVNRSVTYIDNSSQEVTENYDFTVNAPILVGGIIIAPVVVIGPNFRVNLRLGLDGSTSISVGDESNKDVEIGGQPPANPGVPDVDDLTERRIIGVLVTAAIDPSAIAATGIAQGENPDVYAPYLGLVSFAIATDTTFGWTEDLRVKNLRQYIPCPAPQGAVSVAGTGERGVTLTLNPVFSRTEQPRI